MMLDELNDFVNRTSEPLKYRLTLVLDPNRLPAADLALGPLTWQSIPYGSDEIHRVPDDKRGVYAFAISYTSSVLPPHGYVLYIGIAGKDSCRSLRQRYRDYLTYSKVIERESIARMIGCWSSILKFFFAPVEATVSSADLLEIERQLNTALLPPLSIKDVDAEIRQTRRAFP